VCNAHLANKFCGVESGLKSKNTIWKQFDSVSIIIIPLFSLYLVSYEKACSWVASLRHVEISHG